METAITGLGVTLALLCVATAVYIVGNRIARALEARKEEGRREERERCLEIAAREALSARAEGREQGECSALRIKLDINAAKPEPPCSTCGGGGSVVWSYRDRPQDDKRKTCTDCEGDDS